jgi:hypothetical protein
MRSIGEEKKVNAGALVKYSACSGDVVSPEEVGSVLIPLYHNAASSGVLNPRPE